ncbi:DUF6304 family protein [Dictyobacter kobayashii]|uniref:Uncharacterized protein n=1 Tax=Dictyobacter kobayashii TaxID=2014872 RepID=A0A402AEX3_9CHLR|nr:DUF6304 family protein [Dictyobacter kobayashii]GCE17668.1 hypothetical protein KDK_14680 [Dictyobacter kobayashii]
MTTVFYNAIYKDQSGEERIIIENDGKRLKFILRDIAFQGTTFSRMFVEQENKVKEAQDKFTLFFIKEVREENVISATFFCLDAFTLSWDMPLQIVVQNQPLDCRLHVFMKQSYQLREINGPSAKYQLDLWLANAQIGTATGALFRSMLFALQRQLPPGEYIRCCYMCAFSSTYYGNMGPTFGALACFRNSKEKMIEIKKRAEIATYGFEYDDDMATIWDEKVEDVQETYVCAEFQADWSNPYIELQEPS